MYTFLELLLKLRKPRANGNTRIPFVYFIYYYFLFVGCPPCYNEIQTIVNRLRINLRELIKRIEIFNTSSSGELVVDRDFESRLKELTAGVNNLLNKAEKSNSTDGHLQQQLKILDERVGKITEVLSGVWNSTNMTEEVVNSAIEDISEAEASINRSRLLLDEAEKLLTTEGAVALNESIHAANSSSEQATRMAEIRNEVMGTAPY